MVWCSWLCVQVGSQAPQHFRSSETQATWEGCFARQPICSVVSLHSGMSRAVRSQEFSKMDVNHWHMPVWASHIFVASSQNLWGWWHVGSDCHLLRQTSGGRRWLLPPPLSSWKFLPYMLQCLHEWWSHVRTLLEVKPHPDWFLMTRPFSVHHEVLRFSVFLNGKLDLQLRFACWPFSMVLSQVSWNKCLRETTELVWASFPQLVWF